MSTICVLLLSLGFEIGIGTTVKGTGILFHLSGLGKKKTIDIVRTHWFLFAVTICCANTQTISILLSVLLSFSVSHSHSQCDERNMRGYNI